MCQIDKNWSANHAQNSGIGKCHVRGFIAAKQKSNHGDGLNFFSGFRLVQNETNESKKNASAKSHPTQTTKDAK